jgi:predicted  nucleic acid-binding Zn-ribbon protein
MNDEEDTARTARKLRSSRDRWKQRSAEKQQQIRQLRVTVRDLSASREHWKQRVKDLEQQLRSWQATQDTPSALAGTDIFFGGLLGHLAMPQTYPASLSLPSD